MFKSYKYRIYPNLNQRKLIDKTFGACRFVYNLALETKIAGYNANETNVTAFELMRQLTVLKKESGWLNEIDSQALYASIKNMDNAFKNFFRGNGFPKFKSKREKQTFQCPNNTRKVDFEKCVISIPKVHNIKAVINRRFIGKIKIITITKTPTGKYFASVLVDNGRHVPNKATVSHETTIGIDLGIKDFAILSTGLKIENPKHLRSNLKRLKCNSRLPK